MNPDNLVSLALTPTWATKVELPEYGREFSTAVGAVQPIDNPAECAVLLVQADYIDFDVQPVVVRREAPHLSINGCRYALDQAADLARLIQAALQLDPETTREV